MKQRIIIFLVLAVFFLCSASQTHALVMSGDRPITVGPDKVIKDDLFISGPSIVVEGIVEGNLYATGGTVEILGNVSGDVIAMGGNITVSGKIGDDVWIAGGNLRVDKATITDGLTAAGGSIEIDAESKIGGGLIVAGGMINNRAPVGRNVMAAGGMLRLYAPIGGEVQAAAGELILGPKVKIGSDLVYAPDTKLTMDKEATVAGKVRQFAITPKHLAKEVKPKAVLGIFRQAAFGFRVWSFFAALLIGGILLYIAPYHSQKIFQTVRHKFFPSLGWGLLGVMLIGPTFIMLLITVIGIPLAFIVLGLFLLDVYLAKLFVAGALGGLLKEQLGIKSLGSFFTLTLGLVAYYVLCSLPFIKVLAEITGVLLGVGALYLYTKDLWLTGRNRK